MRYDILLYVLGGLCLIGAITTTTLYFTQEKTLLKSHQLRSNVPKKVAELFESWKQEQNVEFTADEESYRLSVFYENYRWVKRNNGTEDVVLGMTQFAALKPEEFKTIYLGYKGQSFASCNNTANFTGDVPTSVDWRTKGDVSAVKNQGQCGSCWSFSTTGSLEAEAAIHGSGLGDFSEQQLVDCSTSYGNQGCNGGLMDQAFAYVIDNGITTEDKYPYKAADGKCQTEGGDFKIAKCIDIPASDCDQLKAGIAQQPISIAVDAQPWQFYIGGVFPKALCGKQLDHGVLAVGYNEKNQWIVKNSWGGSWGQKGYITLAAGNTCGLCNAASYPSIKA